MELFERTQIGDVLRAAGGSVGNAHEALGLPGKTFSDELKRHGLSRSESVDE